MNRVTRIIRSEFSAWAETIIVNVPGQIGRLLRSGYVRRRLKKAGAGLVVNPGVFITGHENIRLGVNVSLGRNSFMYAHRGSIEIGDNTVINSNTTVGAADGGRIVIGNDVIIAQNVVLGEVTTNRSPLRYRSSIKGTPQERSSSRTACGSPQTPLSPGMFG